MVQILQPPKKKFWEGKWISPCPCPCYLEAEPGCKPRCPSSKFSCLSKASWYHGARESVPLGIVAPEVRTWGGLWGQWKVCWIWGPRTWAWIPLLWVTVCVILGKSFCRVHLPVSKRRELNSMISKGPSKFRHVIVGSSDPWTLLLWDLCSCPVLPRMPSFCSLPYLTLP